MHELNLSARAQRDLCRRLAVPLHHRAEVRLMQVSARPNARPH
jgi:hypothetical protein